MTLGLLYRWGEWMSAPGNSQTEVHVAGAQVTRLDSRDFAAAATLALAAALVILPGLGIQSLANWDEAIYGGVTRELLARPGLTLYYGGKPWFEKPPLLFWLMAGSSSIFGLTEMALRLPTAIFGIAAVVLQFFAGRYLGGRVAGVLAAILLLGVAQFVAYSRLAMMDVPLVAFGMLTVVCLLYGERRPVMTLVAGVAFGLAVLTKSVAALLFVPGLLAIVVARRGLGFLWSRELMLAAALALAIALPWHIAAVATHGRSFLDQYLFHHVLARYFRPIHGEDSSFSYFILYGHNAGVFAPIHAAGMAIALLLAAVKRDRLLAALVLFPVAAFIIVNGQATKFGWYLTPVYPGAALAAALGITQVLRNDHWRLTAVALTALSAAPGVINGRGVFVEQYNILDHSPEVRALQHAPPFIKGRAPVLYTIDVAHPAPRFYLADHVQPIDEEELARLVAQKQSFLCLTWKHAGVELTRKYSDSVRIVASTESLAVIRNA